MPRPHKHVLYKINQDLATPDIDWPLFDHWRHTWSSHWLASRRTQQERAGARAADEVHLSRLTPTGRVTP